MEADSARAGDVRRRHRAIMDSYVAPAHDRALDGTTHVIDFEFR